MNKKVIAMGLDVLLRSENPFKYYARKFSDQEILFYISPTVYARLGDLINEPTMDGTAAKEAFTLIDNYFKESKNERNLTDLHIKMKDFPNSILYLDLKTKEYLEKITNSPQYKVSFLKDLKLIIDQCSKDNSKLLVITSDQSILHRCCLDLKIDCEEHPEIVLVNSTKDIFQGYRTITVPGKLYSEFMKYRAGDGMNLNDFLNLAEPSQMNGILNNEFIIGRNCEQSNSGTFLAKCKIRDGKKRVLKLSRISNNRKVDYLEQMNVLSSCIGKIGFEPRNEQQCFALEALLDPTISIVLISGNAGSGKSIIATIAAIWHSISDNNSQDGWRKDLAKQFHGYQELHNPNGQIYITRATIPGEHTLGHLPGSREEKFEPWKQNIIDQFKALLQGKKIDQSVIENLSEQIIPAPYDYIGGRSFLNSFVIVEEAQNFTPREIFHIMSRCGYGSKIVIVGDYKQQIERKGSSQLNNGLVTAIQKLRGLEKVAVIDMPQIERGDIARIASALYSR